MLHAFIIAENDKGVRRGDEGKKRSLHFVFPLSKC